VGSAAHSLMIHYNIDIYLLQVNLITDHGTS